MSADLQSLIRDVEARKANIGVYERQQQEAYAKLKDKFDCRSIPEAIEKATTINDDIENAKSRRDDLIAKAEAKLKEIDAQ